MWMFGNDNFKKSTIAMILTYKVQLFVCFDIFFKLHMLPFWGCQEEPVQEDSLIKLIRE